MSTQETSPPSVPPDEHLSSLEPSQYASLSDEALMRTYRLRLEAGLTAAASAVFRHIFDRYADRLYTLIVRHTGRGGHVEELVQASFMGLIKIAPNYHVGARLRTLLYSIATRKCIDYTRKHKALAIVDAPSAADSERSMADTLTREDASFSGAVQSGSAELREQLAGAVQSLEGWRREFFFMYFVSELPAKEIAHQTGLGLGTVKSRIRLLRGQLHDLLGQTYKDYRDALDYELTPTSHRRSEANHD